MLPGSGLLFRGFLPAAGILASGLFFELAASSVSGTVVTRQGSRVVPVVRASVMAREAAGADVLAVARTDREGRFLIVDLPSPRVALSVQKQGYFTRLANGREGESVALDCSAPEDCARVDFELGAAATVSGIVVDELGEPVGELEVNVITGDTAHGEIGEPARRSTTDDRGYFRVAGLKPGRYRIKAGNELQSFFEEQAVESDPVDVEVVEGGEASGIQITVRFQALRQETSYTVSGKVSGVDLAREGAHWIQARDLPSPSSRRPRGGASRGAEIDKAGGFSLEGLQAGRYEVSYAYRANRYEYREVNWQRLGTIQVSGDVAGLTLTPLPPTGFSGTVKFETRRVPRPIRLSLFSTEGEFRAQDHLLLVAPPDFRFQLTNLIAGRYKIEILGGWRGSGDFYIKGFRRGEELSPPRELVAVEGVVDQFDIVISDEMSRVYGRVKAATQPGAEQAIRKGAQFQVALSGPNRRTRLAQADQYGRFHFDDIPPGEYRICGWADLEGRAIGDDKTWEQAGGAVRKFVVEAGSDVEIDLTAVP